MNSEALFAVLAQLNLLQPITETVEKQLAQFAIRSIPILMVFKQGLVLVQQASALPKKAFY